jgi:hypothetical protein
MSLGDKAMFRFRADYAYGEEGSPERGTAPAIPSGASIEFELEVVDAVSLLAGTIMTSVLTSPCRVLLTPPQLIARFFKNKSF